ncbi:MAG: HAD family hydrolase [Chloroflexi bacterium]|nr:HAD family hydrolase [Chloroflexota bacterium]
MAPIAAVFFDLDGTLLDDDANWKRSVPATVNAVTDRHPHIDAEELEEAYFRNSRKVWDEIRGAEVSPFGDMDATTISTSVWNGALADIGIDDEEILNRAVGTYHRLRNTGLVAFDDVEECLGILRSKYRLGVITNGHAETQQPKLDSAVLSGYFESVTTVDIGHGKPQVEIFDHALNTLGVSANEAVYVGDYLFWDVGGANAAGMHSVWLNRKGQEREAGEPEPDAEIKSLADLPGVVAAFDDG